MTYEHLLIAVEERIATVTIHRPEKLNALNSAVLQELSAFLDGLAGDFSVSVVIITGAGDKAFVAGADIEAMREQTVLEARRFSRLGQEVFSKLERLPQPVIAAVNGYALGGGCELALACDLRIASRNARFGQPEVNLGIIAGFGGTQRLPRLVGTAAAKELLLTGEMISAERALALGLVNQVVEPTELLAKAKEMAAKIAAKAPLAVAYSKRLVNEGINMDLERALALEAESFAALFATGDQKEGMTAFLEKRRPVFQGD